MKKLVFIFFALIGINFVYACDVLDTLCHTGPDGIDHYEQAISSNMEQSVLNGQNISDPLRNGGQQGIQGQSNSISNVIKSDKNNTSGATDDLVKYISSFINWALGMAFFVALAFLIYNGYLVVTAAGNDAQYKKGISYIRYMAIAIAGIGLSFFIIQLIFALIFKMTG